MDRLLHLSSEIDRIARSVPTDRPTQIIININSVASNSSESGDLDQSTNPPAIIPIGNDISNNDTANMTNIAISADAANMTNIAISADATLAETIPIAGVTPADTAAQAIVVYNTFSLTNFITPLIGWFCRWIQPMFSRPARDTLALTPAQILSLPALPTIPSIILDGVEMMPIMKICRARAEIKTRMWADFYANVSMPVGLMNIDTIYETLLCYNRAYIRTAIDIDTIIRDIESMIKNFDVIRAILVYMIDDEKNYHVLFKYENKGYLPMITYFSSTDRDECWNVIAIRVFP